MSIRTVIDGRIFNPKNRVRALKVLHERVTSLWKDCVGIFVVEMVDNIPVDTGMSVASLRPLAAKVGLKTALIQDFRGKGPKPGHSNAYGRFSNNNAKFKSANFGEKLGRKSYRLDFGSPSADGTYRFEFNIVVLQHFLLEHGYAKGNSVVLGSLEKSKNAFREHFETNFNTVVRPKDIVSIFLTGRVRNG